MFAAVRVAQARVGRGQIGEDGPRENAVRVTGRNHGRIHFRAHRNNPLGVPALDGRRGDAGVQRSDLDERYLRPARRSDQVLLQVRDRIALSLGQADEDADLFPAALHAQGLSAEERRTGLNGELL